jgi:tRNA-dihydrouridine synthase B
MLKIGPHEFKQGIVLAPMSGITDLPFRQACHDLGAELTPTEMVTSDISLWKSDKSKNRLTRSNDSSAIAMVQIVGQEEELLALAAKTIEANGGDIIDINLGCPAKKVCGKYAGSALLKDLDKVKRIFEAVRGAVTIPVTAKIRTGWCKSTINAIEVAKTAENMGLNAITIHGRTRDCKFRGHAEFDTIKAVKNCVNIPVIANGDIDSYEAALRVKTYTNADGIMIGRASYGNPWIFSEVLHAEDNTGKSTYNACDIMLKHILGIYALYGKEKGVKIARKHIGWYMKQGHLSSENMLKILSTDCYRSQYRLMKEGINRNTYQ